MADIPDHVSRRPETSSDRTFLQELYISTRREEVDLIEFWSEEEKEHFLTEQFKAQHKYYHQQFGEALYEIILHDGKPAGRLYQEERSDEIRIIDIALLPEYRNQKIGLGLMKEVMKLAASKGKVVRIHVEKNNPAVSFYRRLDFRPIADKGVYYLMEWSI